MQSDIQIHTLSHKPMSVPCTSAHIFFQVYTLTYILAQIYSDISNSQAHTHFYTSTYIHSDFHKHMMTHQIFPYPLKFSHTPVAFTLTHHDADTNTQAQKSLLWCYPTSPPAPRVVAFSAEWCPHPCQAGWEGHTLAGGPPRRSDWALPRDGQGSAPAPQLGVREGFFPTPAPRPRIGPG